MQAQNKPRLGVLALMLEGYEPLFPGITARQHAYVEEVVSSLSEVAECVFPRVALSRADIEAIVAGFNAQGLDGILILLLTYSQGQYLVHAMQRNSLPLALTLVQPDETVGDDFEELELTVNQGIHGSQDNANCLLRAGIPCVFFAGSRKNGELAAFVRDFGAAARTVEAMRRMRIGVIGRLPGMGDVVTDDMAVYRVLGPEFVYDSIGTVRRLCAEADEKEIARLMALDRERFDVDPHMPPERHAESVRMYLGIRAWLEAGGYAGYTLHFDELGADGRFIHLPFLAASNLMAEGYGYAAEGDATCAMLMAAMIRLCGRANFSEMYMMDLTREAILMCHAGEGNWAMARTDRKPFLMDRVFGEGGLDNPPTLIFAQKPGPAAVMSLAHLGGDRFRLVYAPGEVLDKADLRRCDMPYLFFRPQSGVRACVKAWLEQGGTHHEVIVEGVPEERVRLWCRLAGIEFVRI